MAPGELNTDNSVVIMRESDLFRFNFTLKYARLVGSAVKVSDKYKIDNVLTALPLYRFYVSC